MSVPNSQMLADQVLSLGESQPALADQVLGIAGGQQESQPVSPSMQLADQVLSLAPEQPAQEEVKDTLTSRVSNIAEEKNTELTKTLLDVTSGEISPFQGIIQYAGKTGKAALDVGGEVISTALGPTFKKLLPHLIPVDAIKDKTSDYLDTELGKAGMEALNNGIEDYALFKETYPQAAKTIESVVDIALFISPAKMKASAKPASKTLTAVEKKISGRAASQTAKERGQFIDELVRPRPKTKVQIDQISRTSVVGKGILEKDVVRSTPKEKSMAEYVKTVRGVSAKNSFQKNYNLIQDTVGKLDDKLKVAIGKPKVINGKPVYKNGEPVSRYVLVEKPREAVARGLRKFLDENETLRSDNSLRRLAIEYARTAERILDKHQHTPLGVLRARREFDKHMENRLPGTFDPKLTPHTQTVLSIRESMNDLIARSAPTESVRETLKHQSNLLGAMRNIAPKAAKQGSSALRRIWDNTVRVLPWRSRAIQESALLMGTTALAATQLVALPITAGLGIAGTAYIGGRWVVSAQAKRAVSNVLSAANKAIGAAKDPAMLHQLRADRAVLVDIFNDAEFVSDEEYESITSNQASQDQEQ